MLGNARTWRRGLLFTEPVGRVETNGDGIAGSEVERYIEVVAVVGGVVEQADLGICAHCGSAGGGLRAGLIGIQEPVGLNTDLIEIDIEIKHVIEVVDLIAVAQMHDVELVRRCYEGVWNSRETFETDFDRADRAHKGEPAIGDTAVADAAIGVGGLSRLHHAVEVVGERD